MGKADTRVVHIPRWLTAIVWLALTAAMACSVYLLSGRAYARDASLSTLVGALRRSPNSTSVLVAIAPVAADMLFFVPFGALTFLLFDGRSRKVTYLLTIAIGVAFALALVTWQGVLPTRISKGIDAFWNVAGCAAGALLGHARKRVRFRFE